MHPILSLKPLAHSHHIYLPLHWIIIEVCKKKNLLLTITQIYWTGLKSSIFETTFIHLHMHTTKKKHLFLSLSTISIPFLSKQLPLLLTPFGFPFLLLSINVSSFFCFRFILLSSFHTFTPMPKSLFSPSSSSSPPLSFSPSKALFEI